MASHSLTKYLRLECLNWSCHQLQVHCSFSFKKVVFGLLSLLWQLVCAECGNCFWAFDFMLTPVPLKRFYQHHLRRRALSSIQHRARDYSTFPSLGSPVGADPLRLL